jgi:lysophospholipase L1-like esterase
MLPLEPIRKTGLVLFGILVALSIGEGFLTWIDYRYTPLRIKTIENSDDWRFYHAFEDKDFVYDSYLIWRPRRGVPPFNSQGYRGDEITATKSPGSFRIFALGDSNTLGGLGKKDPSWPKYLQELLGEQGNGFQVINAGVHGYSSFQGLRRFQEALTFQPDMVLTSFGWNDQLQVTVSDAEFAGRKIRTLKLDRILLRLRVGQLVLGLSDWIFSQGKQGLVPRVSLAEYETNLTKVIELAQKRSIKVVLLTRPSEDPPSPYDLVTIRVAKSNAVPVIDVYSLFRGKHEYFQDENHFNEEGHRLMAKIMYQHIKGLL